MESHEISRPRGGHRIVQLHAQAHSAVKEPAVKHRLGDIF